MNKNILYLLLILAAFFSGIFIVQNSSQSSDASLNIKKVSASEFSKSVLGTDSITIDIRTPQEYNQGRISGSINMDFYKSDFQEKLSELDKSKSYNIYCNSGNRSETALKLMQDMGFENVVELQGGIQSWVSSGLPTCTDC